MDKNINNILDTFVKNSYIFAEYLNITNILVKYLDKIDRDKVEYSIIKNYKGNDCILQSNRKLVNGTIQTFSSNTEPIKCPTMKEFNDFINSNSDKFTKIETKYENFDFTVKDRYLNTLVDKKILNRNYMLNSNVEHIFNETFNIIYHNIGYKYNIHTLNVYRGNYEFEVNYIFSMVPGLKNGYIRKFILSGHSNDDVKKIYEDAIYQRTWI